MASLMSSSNSSTSPRGTMQPAVIGHAAGFFHDRAELVERLEYSVHGNTLQA